MRKVFGPLLICSVAAGCAGVNPQVVTGPDGKQAYAMQCSGDGRSLEACYEKAGYLCPWGYDVVDGPAGGALVIRCK
jgi:hypothetical protein